MFLAKFASMKRDNAQLLKVNTIKADIVKSEQKDDLTEANSNGTMQTILIFLMYRA